MAVYKEGIQLETKKGSVTYINITDRVRDIVKRSGMKEGLCAVISPHTTCSVIFEEFVHDYMENGNEFLQEDLNNILDKIIPQQKDWDTYYYPGEKHFEETANWPNIEEMLPGGDRTLLWNCDAHIRASFFGSGEVFEVADGTLGFGITGSIYFIDFDRAQARKRKCRVVVIGEK